MLSVPAPVHGRIGSGSGSSVTTVGVEYSLKTQFSVVTTICLYFFFPQEPQNVFQSIKPS